MTEVLLPPELLAQSPSCRDGVDSTEELLHRAFGCELIQEGGILLRLPQVVMATAQNLFHRFFYRKSLKRFDVFSVAMGTLLLSSKIEEKPKILREVIYVFHRMYQRRNRFRSAPLELGGEQYNIWKEELMMLERFILKELGFSFYNITDHPHKYILYFIKVLEGDNELAQCAWNYLNDSLRLDLCLRYKSQDIACSAIYLAVLRQKFPLPQDKEWWVIMGTQILTVLEIAEQILELYEMPKLTWMLPISEDSYLSPERCAQFDSLLLSTNDADESIERSICADVKVKNLEGGNVTPILIESNAGETVRPRKSWRDRSRSSEGSSRSSHSDAGDRRRRNSSRDRHSHSRRDSVRRRSPFRNRDRRLQKGDRRDRDHEEGRLRDGKRHRSRSRSPRRQRR